MGLSLSVDGCRWRFRFPGYQCGRSVGRAFVAVRARPGGSRQEDRLPSHVGLVQQSDQLGHILVEQFAVDTLKH